MPLQSLEKLLADKQVARNVVVKTTTATLKVYETQVEFDSTGGAFTVTLPYVSECPGQIFSFRHAVDNGDVTLAHAGDSLNWTNLVFGDAGDRVVLQSNGRTWHVLEATGI